MMRMRKLLPLLSLFFIFSVQVHAGNGERGVVSLKPSSVPFMSKGSMLVGGSASGSGHLSDRFGISVVNGINSDGYKFSIKPEFSYAIMDDLCLGVSLLYDRGLFNLASAGLSVESVSINVKDYNSLKQNMGAALFCRKYLPIGKSGRVAIYVDGSLGMSFGQSKLTDRQGLGVVGTFQQSYDVTLGVNPGLAAFLTKHFVLSAGVGIAGVGFSWTDQVHNQVSDGRRSAFSASYTVNLLSLAVGAYYCF